MVGAFGVAGVGAPLGDTGTDGTVLIPGGDATGVCGNVGIVGDAAGWTGFRGAAAGDNWAKVVLEYKNETSSASEKDKAHCFFIILVLFNEGLDDIGKDSR
ncbi:hypothetical protein E2542_SST10133 [Spatholobus suberectus]|nr:hypothetical protein E2542_SST10133 [Spatholobus suberectus]